MYISDNALTYSPEQQIQVEQMLLNGGYLIDPEYVAQKYNIPLLQLPYDDEEPKKTPEEPTENTAAKKQAKSVRRSSKKSKLLAQKEALALELVKELSPDFFA